MIFLKKVNKTNLSLFIFSLFFVLGCSTNNLVVPNEDKFQSNKIKTKSLYEIKKIKGHFVSFSEYQKISNSIKDIKKRSEDKFSSTHALKPINVASIKNTPVKVKKIVISDYKPKIKRKIELEELSLKILLNRAYSKRDHSKRMKQAIISKLPMEYAKIDVDMAIEDIRSGITQSKLKELKSALKY